MGWARGEEGGGCLQAPGTSPALAFLVWGGGRRLFFDDKLECCFLFYWWLPKKSDFGGCELRGGSSTPLLSYLCL